MAQALVPAASRLLGMRFGARPAGVPGAVQPVAGICHARGHNADLPPVWLIYITVADLDEAVRQCQQRGGKVRVPPKDMGGQGRYRVIEDPAGAVAALFERR